MKKKPDDGQPKNRRQRRGAAGSKRTPIMRPAAEALRLAGARLEALALSGDETVSDFLDDLMEAVEALISFDQEVHHVWLCDVASTWFVLGYMDPTLEGDCELYRVTYERGADGAFRFTAIQQVERVTSYEPADDEDEGHEGAAAPAVEDTTTGSVAVAPGAKAKKPPKMRARISAEAVENPTDAQRADLPDAAYAAVWKDGDKTYKKLPHHVRTVKSGTDDGTVDLPRLRNALARFDQTDMPAEVKKRASAHLEGHARRLKIGQYAEDADAGRELDAICKRMQEARAALPPGGQVEILERWGFALRAAALGGEPAEVSARLESLGIRDDFPRAAPNGKPFIGFIGGEGAVFGRMSRNWRIFDKESGRAECERIAAAITRAYADAANAGDLQVSQVDHPILVSGYVDGEFVALQGGADLAQCGLMQVQCAMDEESGVMRVGFGVMDTPAGRGLMEYAAYGPRVGFSTRTLGLAEIRVMCPDDPAWKGNEAYDGAEYEYVHRFTVRATDAVKDPAASVYADRVVPFSEAERAQRAAAERALLEAGPPAPPITPTNAGDAGETNRGTEETMNRDELKKALAALAPEEFEALAPELLAKVVKATADKVKQEGDAKIADLTARLTKAEGDLKQAGDKGAQVAALEATVVELKAQVAASKAFLEDIRAERDAARGRAERVEAVAKAVDARKKADPAFKFGKALEAHLRVHFVESDRKLEDLDKVVAQFDSTFVPFLNESAGAGAASATAAPEGDGGDKDKKFLEGISLQ